MQPRKGSTHKSMDVVMELNNKELDLNKIEFPGWVQVVRRLARFKIRCSVIL